MNNKKIEKSNKIYPLYSALSGDLMFYIAISTIYLTIVKCFSASQITFLTTISTIIGIVLQPCILKLIRKIGNLKAMRLGTMLLLVSSIMITICKNYYMFIIAITLYSIAFFFQNMGEIILKGNLEYLGKSEDYIKIKSKSKVMYSTVTAIISLFIGWIFNIYEYLPMIFCMCNCLVCVLLSFCICDANKESVKEKSKVNNNNQRVSISRLAIIIFIFYAVFYGCVQMGQRNEELFIQNQLLKSFNKADVTTILSAIIFVSRMVRIVSSLLYNKVYSKFKDKTLNILVILLSLSFVISMISYMINGNIILQIVVMTLGFSLILAVRDPIQLYMQNYILENFDSSKHQKYITYLLLSRKIGMAIIGVVLSLVLKRYEIVYSIFVIFMVSLLNFVLIKTFKQQENQEEIIKEKAIEQVA